eukprot:TRINITY_DN786_c0_g1_i2.p1 TRINITY_DN786_c0_g1~~TRINITY_DN786_c0_g1_i2.p1  ORF type:complete len:354 (-),score=92.33 TRINITY_DN786_c0_g1_i2:880-1890(-)
MSQQEVQLFELIGEDGHTYYLDTNGFYYSEEGYAFYYTAEGDIVYVDAEGNPYWMDEETGEAYYYPEGMAPETPKPAYMNEASSSTSSNSTAPTSASSSRRSSTSETASSRIEEARRSKKGDHGGKKKKKHGGLDVDNSHSRTLSVKAKKKLRQTASTRVDDDNEAEELYDMHPKKHGKKHGKKKHDKHKKGKGHHKHGYESPPRERGGTDVLDYSSPIVRQEMMKKRKKEKKRGNNKVGVSSSSITRSSNEGRTPRGGRGDDDVVVDFKASSAMSLSLTPEKRAKKNWMTARAAARVLVQEVKTSERVATLKSVPKAFKWSSYVEGDKRFDVITR